MEKYSNEKKIKARVTPCLPGVSGCRRMMYDSSGIVQPFVGFVSVQQYVITC